MPITQVLYLENLITIILVLINVAFITLLERKILGYSQLRLGPNKPSFIGILQPAADAVKLFSNFRVVPYLQNSLFNYIPFLSLLLVLILWSLVPGFFFLNSFSFSIISLLALISIGVYPVMLAGWSSNRKYAELGRLRNIAQTISYEVRLALVVAIIIFNLRILRLSEVRHSYLNLSIWPLLLGVWLTVVIAETNRTPFDFAEGESELVSGFNTEYSSNKFAVVFMAEYARIYFFSALRALIFLSNCSWRLPLFTSSLIFFWIWVRRTLPRHRYDSLMILNWKRILPLVLLILIRASVVYIM